MRASRNNRRTRRSKSAAPVGGDDTRARYTHKCDTRTHAHTNTHDRAAARSFVYPSRRSRVNAPRRLRLVFPPPRNPLRSHLLDLLFVVVVDASVVPRSLPHASTSRYPSRRPSLRLRRSRVVVIIPSFPPPFSLKPILLVFVVPHGASARDLRLCCSLAEGRIYRRFSPSPSLFF